MNLETIIKEWKEYSGRYKPFDKVLEQILMCKPVSRKGENIKVYKCEFKLDEHDVPTLKGEYKGYYTVEVDEVKMIATIPSVFPKTIEVYDPLDLLSVHYAICKWKAKELLTKSEKGSTYWLSHLYDEWNAFLDQMKKEGIDLLGKEKGINEKVINYISRKKEINVLEKLKEIIESQSFISEKLKEILGRV